MFESVRNVFCVGRNYRLHAQELGHEVPSEPIFFMKPTHALVPADGRVVHVPAGEVHHEIEWVVRLLEDGTYEWALGLDLTLREVQNQLRAKGEPWLLSKGFPHSAPVTPFQAFPPQGEEFFLYKNGKKIQHGKLSDMLFPLPELVDSCIRHYGFAPNDLLFTGTPAGVGPVHHGDVLSLRWGDQTLGEVAIAQN